MDPKPYSYKNIQIQVGDDEEVIFRVEAVSNVNSIQTSINIPGDNDPEIPNDESATTARLGTGADLRAHVTVVASLISNLAVEEDEIKVNYYVNNELIVPHSNPKSEAERALVIISINFIS
ncbi:MAG: hypothetical protein AAFW89_11715 [Bacteroidota bacterium]